MALTEIQLPSKTSFYNRLQSVASEMDLLMQRWADMAEFIAEVDTDDLDAMTVAAGQVRTDLIEFRTVMEEVVAFYNGTPTTATNAPNAVVDKIRRM